jgi:hypothetical protein
METIWLAEQYRYVAHPGNYLYLKALYIFSVREIIFNQFHSSVKVVVSGRVHS